MTVQSLLELLTKHKVILAASLGQAMLLINSLRSPVLMAVEQQAGLQRPPVQ